MKFQVRACMLLGLAAPVTVMALLTGGPATRKAMTKSTTKIEEHTAFYVVGLARRTNNVREAAGVGEIGNVWQEFMRKRMNENIPGTRDENLLALYTDYESDQNGDYTYLLGKRVPDLRRIPASLTGRYVPAGRYAVLLSEKGPVTQVVPELWQRVWSMSRLALGGRRTFEADYELYDQRAKDPRNGQVELYLGIE